MVTLEELKEREKEIKSLVDKEIKPAPVTIYPIKDGIIDIEKYFKAKYKILWILKEPYDDIDEDGNPCGSNWDLCEVLSEKKTFQELEGGRRTFIPMTYTSWGVLNNFCQWKGIPNVGSDEDNSLLEALQSVALINVKKLPGYTSSRDGGVLQAAYNKYKNILLRQIKDYEPDIIIGGNTLSYFWEDLGIDSDSLICNGRLNYIIKDGKVFINASHPSQRSSQENYCNDIINTAKIWAENKQ